jgi:hypothetical protein
LLPVLPNDVAPRVRSQSGRRRSTASYKFDSRVSRNSADEIVVRSLRDAAVGAPLGTTPLLEEAPQAPVTAVMSKVA